MEPWNWAAFNSLLCPLDAETRFIHTLRPARRRLASMPQIAGE
jgi:hypothetical protein